MSTKRICEVLERLKDGATHVADVRVAWLAVVLLGCGDGYVSGARIRVDVWHDDARGVTCWIASDKEAAITCLPDSALAPKVVKP